MDNLTNRVNSMSTDDSNTIPLRVVMVSDDQKNDLTIDLEMQRIAQRFQRPFNLQRFSDGSYFRRIPSLQLPGEARLLLYEIQRVAKFECVPEHGLEMARDFCEAASAAKVLKHRPFLSLVNAPELRYNHCLPQQIFDANVLSFGFGNMVGSSDFRRYAVCNSSSLQFDFEHDRARLSLNGLRHSGAEVIMELSYSNIKRVLVDFSKATDRIFFKLHYPPRLFKKMDVVKRSGGKIKSFTKRLRINWFDECSRDVLANSHWLVLVCNRSTPGMSMDVFKLACRLESRCSAAAFFGSVELTDERPPIMRDDRLDVIQDFSCRYGVKALLSHGYPSQTLLTDTFLQLIDQASRANPRRTEAVLDQLCSYFADCRDIYDLIVAFQAGMAESPQPDDSTEEVVRVRRAVFTPTRVHFLPAQQMQTNRIIRRYSGEFMLRIEVRDEDLQSTPKMDEESMETDLCDEIVRNRMLHGLSVCGRQYEFLAWSNSELREKGFYMCSRNPNTGVDAALIRKEAGKFFDQNAGKYMARLGQCFTQSTSLLRIEHDMFDLDSDIKRNNFCFSDGIGTLHIDLARQMAEKLKLDHVPSAFQVRFQGFKGMLSVTLEHSRSRRPIKFRQSMKKFERDKDMSFEMVKHSAVSPVYLGRPAIMIIDHIAEHCGSAVHQKVRRSFHDLLENAIFDLSKMFLRGDGCAAALHSKTSLNIDFVTLEKRFDILTDPFFRGLLLAVYSRHLQDVLKQKLRVHIDSGRCMFGVLDEYGVLAEDEVFIQYSLDAKILGTADTLHSSNDGLTRILRQNVMITKNPCIAAGDIRILRAVDRPCLRHLVDVIVFPQQGDRPLPDQMAGSDLDGDEYSIIWDERFMFTRNVNPQPPLVIPATVKPIPITGPLDVEAMVNCFCHYLQDDELGLVSLQHLAAADREKLVTQQHTIRGAELNPKDRLHRFAQMHSVLVDFPKAGISRRDLEKHWEVANSRSANSRWPKNAQGKYENPNPWSVMFAQMRPDFLARAEEQQQVYRSERILGELYRKTEIMNDVLSMGALPRLDSVTPPVDQDVLSRASNSASDIADAIEIRDRYNQQLQAIMIEYGITDEGQLLSGCPTDVRNRKKMERERESYTFYNMERMLQLKVALLWKQFRNEFFEKNEDPNVQSLASEDHGSLVMTNNARVVAKACTWYAVTYYASIHSNKARMYSFPWIMWDVLMRSQHDRRTPRFRIEDVLDRELQRKGCSIDMVLDKWIRSAVDETLAGLASSKLRSIISQRYPQLTSASVLDLLRYLASNDFEFQFDYSSQTREVLDSIHKAAFRAYHTIASTARLDCLEPPTTADADMGRKVCEGSPLTVKGQLRTPAAHEAFQLKLMHLAGVSDIAVRQVKKGKNTIIVISYRGTPEANTRLRQIVRLPKFWSKWKGYGLDDAVQQMSEVLW